MKIRYRNGARRNISVSYVNCAAEGQGFAIINSGQLWLWGRNDFGQLGNNTAFGSMMIVAKPIQLSPNSIGNLICDYMCGYNFHTITRRTSDGTGWGWGSNYYGQLGANSNPVYAPTSVRGGISFTFIAGCSGHSVGINGANGTAWAWGHNSYGQLGCNNRTNYSSPISVVGEKSWAKIFCQANQTIAIDTDGKCYSWGQNNYGQLGDGTTMSKSSPVSVVGDHLFTQLCGNNDHVHGLEGANGTVWSWGQNISNAALGISASAHRSTPTSVVGGHSFIQITCNGSGAAGLKEDGTVWAWGQNSMGEVGDNTRTTRSSPVSVVGDHSFISIAGGCSVLSTNSYYLALKADGTLWGWGFAGDLQFGPSALSFSSPVCIPYFGGDRKIVRMTTGDQHYHCVDTNGRWWGMGRWSQTRYDQNRVAAVSMPRQTNRPMRVSISLKIVSGNVARSTAVAIANDGSAWSWGSNQYGELGIGTTISKSSPSSILGGKSFSKIYNASQSMIGIDGSDGSAWSWGYNNYGQLGDNSKTNRSSPVSVVGSISFKDVVIDATCSLGIKGDDGTCWSWGYNSYGQLGDNTTTDRSSPVSVVGGRSAIQIAMNHNSGSFLINGADGTVWAWGQNTGAATGFLGISIAGNQSTPRSVAGGHTFKSICAGDGHCLALKDDGTCWSWGLNSYGQLGDNSITSRSYPVSVRGDHSFVSIRANSQVSMGIKSDGSIWVWGGDYTYNQLFMNKYEAGGTFGYSSPVAMTSIAYYKYNKGPAHQNNYWDNIW